MTHASLSSSLKLAVVAQCKNFNDLRAISFAAAIMSLSYSTIAIGVTLHNGKQPNVEYNLNGLSTANGLLNAFNSLGIIAFACVPVCDNGRQSGSITDATLWFSGWMRRPNRPKSRCVTWSPCIRPMPGPSINRLVIEQL